ncbi:MAG: ABC transporter ATP-binding protein [Tepidanaerobacteraceae bacterium]
MKEIMKINHLSKKFGGIKAVDDVTLTIHEGELLGLIGPNGSGKSTFVNLITGFYTPDSGQVMFQGHNILNLSIAKRSRLGIGRTFQSPKPFTRMTVFESIYTIAMQTLSMKDAENKSEEIMDMMQLTSQAEMPSEMLPIEKRKWLDMARILATDPKIIMMDEVLAGLNPREMATSVEMVRKINASGIAILFIEHVMSAVVNLCERIVVLNEGRLLAEGVPDEVMNNPKVINVYLGGGYKHASN